MSADLSQPAARMLLDGVPVAAHFGDLAAEVGALRGAVAVSSLDHVTTLRISGPDAFAAVDRLCPLDLFLRDGQLRQTLLLQKDGTPLADVLLACDDESWLLMCEGAPRAALVSHITATLHGFNAALADLTESHALLSLNGPFSWEVMTKLEGEQVIAFPYLSFYAPRPGSCYLRAGKTGEFGYDLLIPRAERDGLLAQIIEAGGALGLVPAGMQALWQCALENWFFNIYREGQHGLTPIELGLQWRVSYSKEYLGSEAINARRERGAETRLTAITSNSAIKPGAKVYQDGACIGAVLCAERSFTLNRWIGVALLDAAYAFSGLDSYRAGSDPAVATPLQTVSAPFVNNLSLYVNPQQHSYQDRAAIAYPGPDRASATRQSG